MLTQCPLFETSFYSYTIDLSDDTYTLTFRWSDRANQWFLSVDDAEENNIVRSIALVPYYPLLQQLSLDVPEGDFFLLPIEEADLTSASIPDPRRIYQTHFLVFDDFQD